MEQRIRELVNRLNEYSKAYYVMDAPKISDKEYDELFEACLSWNSRPVLYCRIRPPSGWVEIRCPGLRSIPTYSGFGALTRCAPVRT